MRRIQVNPPPPREGRGGEGRGGEGRGGGDFRGEVTYVRVWGGG
jgi:hypothetical protein